MQDQKVLRYNTIMLTMVGLQNVNGLIMSNNNNKQSVTVQHTHTFRIVKQKNGLETYKNKLAKSSFMLSEDGSKQ